MLKAGSAGSNPDGIASEAKVSQPLQDFLRAMGDAVSNLNTIVVGLDAVEKGHEKPASIDITWTPRDRKFASRKARKFALEGALVRCRGALGQYTAAISNLDRYQPVTAKWNSKTSAAEKLNDIAVETVGPDSYLVPGALLVMHWRNRVVHESRAALTYHQSKLLRSSASAVATTFKNLDVERLLTDFETGRPTLKDVSSLIAMSIRLVRQIDIEVQSSLTKADVDVLLDHYGLTAIIEKVRAESSPLKQRASILSAIRTHAPMVLSSYEQHYPSV